MTTAPELKIEIKEHSALVFKSDLPIENAIASVVFVSLLRFTTGSPNTTFDVVSTAAMLFFALTTVDALAPSMSTSLRLSIPFFFSLRKQ